MDSDFKDHNQEFRRHCLIESNNGVRLKMSPSLEGPISRNLTTLKSLTRDGPDGQPFK